MSISNWLLYRLSLSNASIVNINGGSSRDPKDTRRYVIGEKGRRGTKWKDTSISRTPVGHKQLKFGRG